MWQGRQRAARVHRGPGPRRGAPTRPCRWRVQQADRRADLLQTGSHRNGVLTSGGVTVGDHHDVRPGEQVGVLRPPLPCAAGVAGADVAGSPEPLDVLLTLRHVHGLALDDSTLDLGQPVQHPAHVPELPHPPALAARPADRSRSTAKSHSLLGVSGDGWRSGRCIGSKMA